MADIAIKRALVAVYDKTGIAAFAKALVEEFGVEIISTGGTARHLKEAGVPVTLVEEITGFPEMLDGRVKTLHPKIHAAILADRDNPEHMRQLAEQAIQPIDMVVVNLYPFEKTVADPNCTLEQAIEMIDIGGPCLLRAAAKNHRHVLIVHQPAQYAEVLELLRRVGRNEVADLAGRRVRAATGVYQLTCHYDGTIAEWLGEREKEPGSAVYEAGAMVGHDSLRYGENPHQQGRLLRQAGGEIGGYVAGICGALGDSATDMSFNNYADASAALELCAELTRPAAEVWHQPVWHRLIAGATPSAAALSPTTPPGAKASGAAADRRSKGNTPVAPIAEERFARRNLPHLQRPGATYFVTFRVRSGALDPMERDIVMECCLHPDGKKACIHAAVVMPDHVHILLTPLEAAPGRTFHIGDILHGVKGVSGRRIADHRGRESGAVWLDESWDRIMRGKKEFFETLEYIRSNASTAGVVKDEPYPWCVYEQEPGWSAPEDAAGVDLQHLLVCDADATGDRTWHRLLAGATPSTPTLSTPTPSNPTLSTPTLSTPTLSTPALSTSTLSTRTPSTSTPAVAERGEATPHSDGRVDIACFIKHTNACGAAVHADPIEAYRLAYLGDPNAAMGGVLAVSFHVEPAFAEAVMETYQRWGKAAGAGGFFVEVWIAPSFDEQAVEVIRAKKDWGKRARLLAVGNMTATPDADAMAYRTIAGGLLVQTPDLVGLNEDRWKVVTQRTPTEAEIADLRLAWLICKHTKSNAITVCRDGMLIGNGAGQMSRVMSCRIAAWLAKENGHGGALPGAVAASDAFFPFRDGPDILIDAGVTALIQPGGSKRDEDVIAACNERGVAMVFTATRHFRH